MTQSSPDRAAFEQAIARHLRLTHGEENAWIDFTRWLEADPAHNAAYESVFDADASLPSMLALAPFPSDRGQEPGRPVADEGSVGEEDIAPRPRSAWRWGALAASVAVAMLLVLQLLQGRSSTYAIETPAGETRTVALGDSSTILLNGATTVVLDRNDRRTAELARGEARFVVKHDLRNPFVVLAGDQRLIDVGTAFNVVRVDRGLRVGVAEGGVRFEGPGGSVELRAGDILSSDGRGKVTLGKRPISSIGSWADGVLVYDQAPVAQVAEDLSRALGVTFEVPAGLRERRFSGVIQTSGGHDMVRARVAELLGRRIVADGTRWSVAAR